MKIKQYFNAVDIPSSTGKVWPEPLPTASGERMAAGKQAIAGVGQALQTGGAAIGSFLEEKRKLDETLEAANLYGEVRTRVKSLEIELAKNPNEETHVLALKNGIGTITSETLAKTKSKNVQAALSEAFSALTAERLNAGQDFAFKTYLAKSGGKYSQALYDLQQAYITTDEKGRARIGGEAEALIKSAAFSLGRDPGEDMRNFQREAVSGAIRADAVIDAKGTMAKLQAGGYKGVWEQDRPGLIKMCEGLARAQEAEETKVRVDTVAKGLMTRYGNDFDSMFNALADPQFLKDKNLTVQEAHDINTVVKSQQQNFSAAKQRVYHKTGQDAFVQLEKGTLTPQQLSAWVANDVLTEEQGRVYFNALQARANSAGGATTDNNLFIHRFNQIKAAAGNTPMLLAIRDQITKDASKGQFKHEDYVQLWNLTASENDAVFKDEYFKMSDTFFKQQLGFQTKIGAMGEIMEVAPNPRVSQAYFNAQLDLIRAYKEDPKLRGEALFRKATEVLIPHRMKLTEMLGGAEEPKKPTSPTVMGEATPEVRSILPDPRAYLKQHGSIPLRDKQTGIAYKTDGKTWWEIKQ